MRGIERPPGRYLLARAASGLGETPEYLEALMLRRVRELLGKPWLSPSERRWLDATLHYFEGQKAT